MGAMNEQPVDLSNLREVTEGDVNLEKKLFDKFFEGAEANLTMLEQNCVDGPCKNWTDQAHALKGAALNMGAFELGSICEYAQNMNDASAQERLSSYQQIKQEYAQVKAYLEEVHPTEE